MDISSNNFDTTFKKSPIFNYKQVKKNNKRTYYDLIGEAIKSSSTKKMKVSQIYSYIMKNYKMFSNNTDKWQNSIRHALSFNTNLFCKDNESNLLRKKGNYWKLTDQFDYLMSNKNARSKFSSTARLRTTHNRINKKYYNNCKTFVDLFYNNQL